MTSTYDRQRIENAAWVLFQYRDVIVNMAEDMRLDRYEVEAMFKTLSYVKGNVERINLL